jgi:uncharacterized protein (TIGR02996 family)
MTQDDAFLAAILAASGDDAPRLVFADWLEERGNPRGEFIRVQCLLAGLAPGDRRRPPLERRERRLLALHQGEWLGSLRPLLSGWSFRRGFLDAIAVPAAVYLKHTTFPRPATVRELEVDLGGFEAPPAVIGLVPESVARENVLLPIGLRGRRLVLAVRGPLDADLLAKMQFILNRDIEPVAADAGQVVEAIGRHYGQAELESVTTTCFLDPAIDPEADAADGSSPVARLVDLVIAEAMAVDADRVRIEPLPGSIRVQYRIGRRWVDRDTPPRRLLDPIVARIRRLAGLASDAGAGEQSGRMSGTIRGLSFDLGVLIRPTNDGPSVALTFLPTGSNGGNEVT